MTSAFFSCHAALLATARWSQLISACGGNKNDSGPACSRTIKLSSDIAARAASDYYAADASTAAPIELSSLTASLPLFTQVPASTSDKLLLGEGVYTVFMFGSQAAPSGVFRRDH